MNNNEERTEILVKKIKVNKNNWCFDEDGEFGFFTYDKGSNESLSALYNNFEVSTGYYVDEEEVNITMIKVLDRGAFDILRELLESNDSYYFWDAVIEVEYMFSKTLRDYLKFRGDYAEAMVCYLWNAEKNPSDLDTTDLIYNGEKIEIKSLSANTTKIEISKAQSENDIDTYAVMLNQANQDKGGMSIIEIASRLEGGNSVFKKYLIEKYSQTDIGVLTRFKVDEKQITNITEIVHNSITSPNIISAVLRLPSHLFKKDEE